MFCHARGVRVMLLYPRSVRWFGRLSSANRSYRGSDDHGVELLLPRADVGGKDAVYGWLDFSPRGVDGSAEGIAKVKNI